MTVMGKSDQAGSLCEIPRAEANKLHALVRRAALAVHRELGGGLSESVYQNALCLELQVLGAGTTVTKEETRPITYRGKVVGTHRHDIVFGKCIIETKTHKTGCTILGLMRTSSTGTRVSRATTSAWCWLCSCKQT